MKRQPQPQTAPPPDFLAKMRALLPAGEFDAFLAAYDRPPTVGLRVNTLKIAPADFTSLAPFSLAPVGAWEPAAFVVTGDSRPGRHPHHDAGLYYLQDPSAMTAAAASASNRNVPLVVTKSPAGKMRRSVGSSPGAMLARQCARPQSSGTRYRLAAITSAP